MPSTNDKSKCLNGDCQTSASGVPGPPTAPKTGDYVICIESCEIPDCQTYFEVCPSRGDAFEVLAADLPLPPGLESSGSGLHLRGVLNPDGCVPEFGFPPDNFRVCTEKEARTGWLNFRRGLDRARVWRFQKLVNSGADFEDLPPILRKWWLARY